MHRTSVKLIYLLLFRQMKGRAVIHKGGEGKVFVESIFTRQTSEGLWFAVMALFEVCRLYLLFVDYEKAASESTRWSWRSSAMGLWRRVSAAATCELWTLFSCCFF